MKCIKTLSLFLLTISLTGCNSTSYKPKKLDPDKAYDNVYLIMGQSNASGCSYYQYLETLDPELYAKYNTGNNDVLITYDCDDRLEYNFLPTQFGFGHDEDCFGPEIGMAEVLSEQEGTSYIIKATFSATGLMSHYVSPKNKKKLSLYKRFLKFITTQLKALEAQGKNPRVRGVFWMQGESDTFLEHPEKYGQAQELFVKYLRHDLNNWIYDHFNFVDAYIFTRGICWVNPEIINDAKQKFADENEHCYCIKTNGEDETAIKLYLKCETNEGDDLAHYDSSSMVLLGKTAGQLIIK